jgi:hypothetical protein
VHKNMFFMQKLNLSKKSGKYEGQTTRSCSYTQA